MPITNNALYAVFALIVPQFHRSMVALQLSGVVTVRGVAGVVVVPIGADPPCVIGPVGFVEFWVVPPLQSNVAMV